MKKLCGPLFLRLVVLTLITLHCAPSFAVKVTSLYSAQIAVTSQSDEMREQAVREGFLQVLIKVTGDPTIANNDLIKSNLSRADYYVQEFSYSPSTTSSSEFSIQVHYDQNDINRLLKKAGAHCWGENRPLILVWLAVTDVENNTALLIGNETPGDILTTMQQQSKKYGLPLILPLLDVTDVSQVSFTDVASMALPILKQAAIRYAPDALLIGKMQKNNDAIQSQWHLTLNNALWSWTISAKTSDEVIATIMNQVSQVLARRSSIKKSHPPETWVNLQISNVTQSNDLGQIMQYLTQLTPVTKVKLSEVSGNVVELAVLVHGSLDIFKQNVALGQRLIQKSQYGLDGLGEKMTYAWVHQANRL